MKRHILIEEHCVAQPQGAVLLVVTELLPQCLRPLPQRFIVGHVQQLHHLLLRLAVRQLRQHPQRRVQAYRRIHSIPVSDKKGCRRFVAEPLQRLRVHSILRFPHPCGHTSLRNDVLPHFRTAAARQHQHRQHAAQYSSYFFHPIPSLQWFSYLIGRKILPKSSRFSFFTENFHFAPLLSRAKALKYESDRNPSEAYRECKGRNDHGCAYHQMQDRQEGKERPPV